MGINKAIEMMLESNNFKVIDHGLTVLDNVLMKGEILKEEHGLDYNYCFFELEEVGILKQLEKLQNIEDERLYEKVAHLIDRYLPYQ